MVAVMIAADSEMDPEESESEFTFDLSVEDSARFGESPPVSDAPLNAPRHNLFEEALRRQPDDTTIPVDDALSFVTDLFCRGGQSAMPGSGRKASSREAQGRQNSRTPSAHGSHRGTGR
jgi:hypothetical protein